MLHISLKSCLVNCLLWALLTSVPATGDDLPLTLTGPLVQGGMLIGQTDPEARVSLDGQLLTVDPQGYFVMGFGRDAEKAQLLSVRIPGRQPVERVLQPARRAYQIERIDGLPANTVNPPASVIERINREAGQVSNARARRDQRSDWRQNFVMPSQGRISGVYGSQRVLNGEPRRPHYGLDIAADEGTAIVAPAAGIVTLAEPDLYYSGGTVIIDHGHGVSSTFLHMQSVDVEVGQTLAQGDYVGGIGATGRATGPHLDWRMNWRDQRIDPMLLLEPDNWQPADN